MTPERLAEMKALAESTWTYSPTADLLIEAIKEIERLRSLVPTPFDRDIDAVQRDHVAELQQEVIRLNGENVALTARWEGLRATRGVFVLVCPKEVPRRRFIGVVQCLT